MELYSREALTPANAEAQLVALASYEHGLFRPEKCDVHEPVRERFDPGDLREPVRWLSQPGGQFTFRRDMSPSVEGYISNLRRRQIRVRDSQNAPWVDLAPRFPEPIFRTRWVVRLGSEVTEKPGARVLRAFLIRMFLASRSEYGFLTTDEDHLKKNFQVTLEGDSTLEHNVGTDPANGVPGLYWINLFGPTYSAWLGTEKLTLSPGRHESLAGGSSVLQFGESPETCSSPEILLQQRDVRKALGEEKFSNVENAGRYVKSPFDIVG